MAHSNLNEAKRAKNDEFYTQFIDIAHEVSNYLAYNPEVFKDKTILLPCDDPEWSNFTKYFAQNFDRFGIKELISTSYAAQSKHINTGYTPTLFESDDAKFDAHKTNVQGKIFVLNQDITGDGRINIEDLTWDYLEGDGDFRSNEVITLRDKADIIITNPPFSLFREFLAWIMEANKSFLIIGNMNAITYKEVFPLIKENKMWLGYKFGAMEFRLSKTAEYYKRIDDEKNKYAVMPSVVWFTNIVHGRRKEKLSLMNTKDVLKFGKVKSFQKYDNYDAIEVPLVRYIPSDYEGVMGVPVSFLDKYNPEQFEILGATQRGCHDEVPDTKKYDDYWEVRQNGKKTGSSGGKTNENAVLVGNDGKKNYFINANNRVVQSAYQRLFIKHRKK